MDIQTRETEERVKGHGAWGIGQGTEGRRQRTEDRRRRTEGRRQKTEDRGQRTEDSPSTSSGQAGRGQRTGWLIRKLEN